MHALTTTLFLLLASTLLVQAGTIPKDEETNKAVNVVNNGFSIKTGHEGYIATVKNSKAEKSDLITQVEAFFKSDLVTKMTLFKNYFIAAKGLLLPVLFKIIASVKILSFVLLWGVIATHTVCKFTSLCSFSMNLPEINKEDIKSRIVNMARPYMSDETLNYTVNLARSAIDNYNSIQEYM